MSSGDDEVLRLAVTKAGWLDGYTAALGATAMGAVSQQVVVADSRFIADRAVLPVDDPAWSPSRVRTGAVMGAVQSGKTASMIGVLARALDLGVNVAVVLAGTQTSLWLQTLSRLRAQLDGAPDPMKRRLFLPNPRDLEGERRVGPSRAYAVTELSAARALQRGRPIVVVAMKQVDHLLHLGRTLREVVYPAGESVGRAINLLVIDDEADDSSVADDGLSWDSPDLEIFKQVPRRIVDLWEHRSHPGRTTSDHVFATYIAYTATPQANFLQDPQNPLAPRDFVAALRTPGESGSVEPRSLTYRVPENLKGWYTGSDIFYGDLAPVLCAPDPAELVQDDDESTEASSNEVEISSLVDPVRAYLVAAAVRLSRSPGLAGPASASSRTFADARRAAESISPVTSMLIHPSSAKQTHFDVADLLRNWWVGDGSVPGAGVLADISADETAWVSWLDSYRASALAVRGRYETIDPAPPERTVPTWPDLKDLLLNEIVPGTKIAVINSDPAADDRPDFEPWEDDAGWHAPANHSTIFIAGNVMSRGLTLEGLLSTLFTRTSSAPLADTQMQMQRWFGYRGAYIDVCRVFLSSEQLDLFTQYADADHALRSQVLAAMAERPGKLPDFTVLQGLSYQATGKVARVMARELRPGTRPLVRHLNPPGCDEHNLRVVSDLLTAAHSRQCLVHDDRGLVTTDGLSLMETAELLDNLRYVDHGTSESEQERWRALERQAGIDEFDAAHPLYRAPSIAGPIVDLGSLSPYSIAAYLRLWAACLDREVRGLMTDDEPPQRWSLVSLEVKKKAQPRFRVGLRLGTDGPVSAGPIASLGSLVGRDLRPMKRAVDAEGALAAGWGSRRVSGTGYVGDDLFDLTLLAEEPNVHADGSRVQGSSGLLLFQLVGPPGEERVAVGLSIPRGGPDHVEALSLARQRGR